MALLEELSKKQELMWAIQLTAFKNTLEKEVRSGARLDKVVFDITPELMAMDNVVIENDDQ